MLFRAAAHGRMAGIVGTRIPLRQAARATWKDQPRPLRLICVKLVRMVRHYLQPLLAPRSVALVGATEREGALGASSTAISPPTACASSSSRSIRSIAACIGKPAYARLTQLPKAPDLAVIAVPARAVPQVIEDAGAAGIRAAVVLTSGFGEAGDQGKKLQEEMLAAARRGGVRILGPNCLGVMRTRAAGYGGLNATFARTPALPGKLALVSQSGAICGAILEWAA